MVYEYSGKEDAIQNRKRNEYLSKVTKEEFIQNKDYMFYIREVQKGNIPVCDLVKKATKRELDKFEQLDNEDFPYWFDEYEAYRYFNFCRTFYIVQGAFHPFVLNDWQIFVFSMILGWKKKSDNLRQYKYCYIEVPRGSGKSTMMAVFELWMLCRDGEWTPEVYIAATKKEQAKILFGSALRQVDLPENKLFCKNYLKLEQYRENIVCRSEKGGKMVALSRDGKTMDGLDVHCAVVDEIHAHPDSTTWDVLDSGSNKRSQTMMVGITTAGTSFTGFGFQLSNQAKDIINGRKDDRWFCCVWTIDRGDDVWDVNSLIKATPGWWYMGDRDRIIGAMAMAKDYPEKRSEALTKYLCVWCNTSDKWLNPDHVFAQKDLVEPESAFSDADCIIGVDLSECEDLTVCANVYERLNPDDGKMHYYVFPKIWTPEKALKKGDNIQKYNKWVKEGHMDVMPGEIIDLDKVQEYIESQIDDGSKRIQEVAFDRWNATQMAGSLQNRYGAEYIIAVNQSTSGMNEASKYFKRLLIEGRIHYSSPVFEWACLNAMVKVTDNLIKIQKNPTARQDKIDPLMATINSIDRFMKRSNMWFESGIEIINLN